MADYTSDRTGASIDTVLDNVDAGVIRSTGVLQAGLDTVTDSRILSTSLGQTPGGNRAHYINIAHLAGYTTQLQFLQSGRLRLRGENNQTWGAWQELYHTGNTGLLIFSDAAVPSGVAGTRISESTGGVYIGNVGTTSKNVLYFTNANGPVGSITTSGTSTSYNTSSDPRLKDFKTAPTDAEINAKFDDLFGCFKTFKWKNDVDGDLVWGFDAHATIDAGLDMGSEGKGSRDLALGDVYDTTPAELDEDGVETKAAIEHKVTPAGVDQSKAVPILLAKIEQLERRLAALEV